MDLNVEELEKALAASSHHGGAAAPPEWLARLLKGTPGLPADVVPHHRPNHTDLQGAIADASFHPAIEACLHLINADLYSAHFLVRKAQGGSRYLDWLHAILHKLEGDFRNAKMWYTDLGNNNAGALVGSNDGEPTKTRDKAEVFRSFHEFWFVSAANGGGGGDRVEATDLNVAEIHGRPRDVRLTAHEHTDLVFLCSVLSQAGSPSATNLERVKREVEIHHSSTTLAEAKIKDSQSAFSLDELYLLCDRLAQDGTVQGAVRDWTQLELLWMLDSMQNKFGWRKYDLAETMEAFRVESTPAHESMDEERKSKASNMVLDPGQGQRKF